HDAPLYKLLGGGVPRLSTDFTISVDYIDKMVSDSLKTVEQGFDAIKVMAGKDVGLDIKRVEAIYAAIGDQALIRLDGNEGWKPKEALVAIRELEARGIPLELVEQPVAGHDREGLRYVAERVSTPILTDEAIQSPLDAIDLIRMRAADMINIKLGRLGGISNAIKIADIASLHNVECMAGCVTESSISVAAAAHVAVAKANIITKIDLDASALSKSNPVKCGTVFDGPTIPITDAPGLGVEAIDGLEIL
ncbi:MAG: enolase C-terminal domain-like protein, partial [Amphiplicatus sp.]